MLKICASAPSLKDTLFERPDFLVENGIKVVSEASQADLVVSGTLKNLLKYILRFGHSKKYLLWTIEPRFSKHFRPTIIYPFLPTVHVMNIYTGMLSNNYFFVPRNLENLYFKEVSGFQNKRVVSLMTYQAGAQWNFIYKDVDLDLCNLRTEIALDGYRRGILDIYGRNWPDGISLGQSRGGNFQKWQKKKLDILSDYHFNLCFENTNWPYYCTEKIWDSIQGGCLPIYYGKGNKIYEDFPRNSFLDYSDFDSPKSLFDYIQKMDIDEFNMRMKLCIQVLDRAIKKRKEKLVWKELSRRTVEKIWEISR